MKRDLDAFTQAYIEAALWSSTAYGHPEESKMGDSFDSSFESLDVPMSKAAIAVCARDCKAFQRDNADLLAKWYGECSETEERAGHDFWLTRNGHGAGYWDRWSSNTPQGKIGDELTVKAHEYGEVNMFYSRGKALVA